MPIKPLVTIAIPILYHPRLFYLSDHGQVRSAFDSLNIFDLVKTQLLRCQWTNVCRVSGCSSRCVGCQGQVTHTFIIGQQFRIQEIMFKHYPTAPHFYSSPGNLNPLTFCTEEPFLLILKMVQLAWMMATSTRAAMQATTTYSFTLALSAVLEASSSLVLTLVVTATSGSRSEEN